MSRVILFLFLGVLLSCSKTEKPRFQISKTNPSKQIVVDSLNHPWSMAFLSEDEVLVSEKDGDLLRVDLSSKRKTIIKGFPTDLTDSIRVVSRGDNSGIFEVVLDPDFDNNNFVYLSYAAKKKGKGSTTKVVRATLKNDSLYDRKTILEAGPFTREYYHYGGGMTFGTDQKLYITIGERLFREIDEPALPIAQDLTDKRGKIYRFNADGSIPKDNPDFGPDAVPGLYAIGIRAAQGITVQPITGDIWFSEHGTKQGDEINRLSAGANYGWPIITTGGYRSRDYVPPHIEGASFTDPDWYWKHTVAPTGLMFYTGDEFPEWKNDLLVPGLSVGSFWRFTIENQTIKSAQELFVDDRVRSRKITQSPNGKLYMLTDEDNGKIVRIKNLK
ncbi:PQQ-dependent sugar dehydrogenase [Aquimarina sp. AD10]|uniref:PQQ-dependent sugar dehydrogenase n=1 Tax=Aquimarina sp. AD10 TaxID=1714849 RepID=UPI000E4C0F84|nr:PQQ-dependent sugar dehydrogenase [Aquimarina sp. AD10]AXT61683.1 PQQ-dependent sugar dehydrogenase [Aquimarina sp. AD10]RKN00968.1 PQQ-dependent sugar dehydrogenase [Aquimarina sp. AD10]